LIAAPEPLPAPVKLTVGVNKVPHFCPMDRVPDMLKKMNIECEVAVFARYADTRTAMASGSIDLGAIGPADVPISVAQGLDTVVGLMGLGVSPKNPIVRNGVTVDQWSDLEGKRVGIAPGSAVWFQFAATLEEVNVPYSKLQIVNIQGGGMPFVQSMQRGDIDAFIGWEPFESMAIADNLATRVTKLDYSKSKAVGAELGLLGANKDAIANKKEAVRRFIWAYLKAQEEVSRSKDELATTIAHFTGLDPKFAPAVAATLTLGQFLTIDQVQRQAQAFYKFGVIPKDVSADLPKFFNTDLVRSVQKA
jgi:sulfonate transport system substrate-binding protein